MPSDTVVTLTAGALSGIVADVITHPMCTVKARLMTQGVASAGEASVVYTSFGHGFVTILRTEGIGALYSGIGAVAVGAAPAQSLFFAGMTGVQYAMGDSPSANFCAGLGAQLTGSLAWVPMEVIKEKLMIQGQLNTKVKYGSSLELVQKVISTEGIYGVYRGFWMQQLTYGPLNGLAIMFTNMFKPYLPTHYEGTVAGNFMCALVGYGGAGLVTNPFDVVKTRVQVQMSNPELFNYEGSHELLRGLDCAKKMLANEGITAFAHGVSGRVLWLAPRCAIAFAAFGGIADVIKGK